MSDGSKRLDGRALAYASAAVCGISALMVGLANLAVPAYGVPCLELLASIYPGYAGAGTLSSVLILTGYALVDGAILGWLFGALYNRLVNPNQTSNIKYQK